MTLEDRAKPKPSWVAFQRFFGDGPFDCYECGLRIEDFWGWREEPRAVQAPVIHHLDGNHSNNDPRNLVPMHHGCHTTHHMALIKKQRLWVDTGSPELRLGEHDGTNR